MSSDVLGQLSEAGVSVWLDDISRDRLRTGNLQSLMDDYHVVGVTSNPTIFAKALSQGDAYDEQVKDLKIRGVSVEEASRALTTYDIRWACDVLRPVYDATNGVDGRVSIEVDPRVAKDTEKTIAEARNLWWMVDRPNAYIKIPATHEGLEAITETIAAGDQRQRHADLLPGAARRGHRRLHGRPGEGQGERARPVQDLLGGLVLRQPDGHRGRRQAGQAGHPGGHGAARQGGHRQRRLAYELFENKCAEERWQALAAAGANVQRPLWASTSTKDPTFPDTMYVVDLVVSDTVNTMPEATIKATADHGELRGDTVHGTYDQSRQVIADLEELGISYDDVVQVLEDEGVAKFEASWNELLETIRTNLEQ